MKVGLFGIIGVVFLTLKLTEQIDWSWWFVLMPFYLLPTIFVIAFLIIWVAIIIKECIKKNKIKEDK